MDPETAELLTEMVVAPEEEVGLSPKRRCALSPPERLSAQGAY
jgi:hypothetical protein